MTIVASIYGRAARDGELRTSQSGKPWCRVSVAVEAGVDRETGDSLTQWLTVVAFGHQAEELAKIEKGLAISAIGRVEINRWRTQDGQEREDLQLIADSVVAARSARPAGRKPKGDEAKAISPAAVERKRNRRHRLMMTCRSNPRAPRIDSPGKEESTFPLIPVQNRK